MSQQQRCPGGRGVGARRLYCPSWGGGRCSGPGESVPAAPASSQPLHSALFRAPGAINRGSWSGAAALALPPHPVSSAPQCLPGRASPRLSLEAGGDTGLVTASLGRVSASRAFVPASACLPPRASWTELGGGGPHILHPHSTPTGRRENSKLGLGEGLGVEQRRTQESRGNLGCGRPLEDSNAQLWEPGRFEHGVRKLNCESSVEIKLTNNIEPRATMCTPPILM